MAVDDRGRLLVVDAPASLFEDGDDEAGLGEGRDGPERPGHDAQVEACPGGR
jgi:hypothetical protein